MKKIIALILLVSMALFALFSCDKKKDDEEEEDTEIQTPIIPPKDPDKNDEDIDLDGVDDDYMPDDGWTFS